MNFKEGTRRLALFMGAVGAILGGFASYLELQSVLGQRERHNKFEQLAASDVVKNERNAWPLALRYAPKEAIEALRKLPENQQRDVLHTLTNGERVDLLAKLKCASSEWGVNSTATIQGNLSQVDPFVAYARPPSLPKGYTLDTPASAKDDPYACTAESSDPPASTVNEGGIRAIHWTKTLAVESIETEDGDRLYPTPAPSRWRYLLAAILPLLGFVIPWGLIRAVGWVGAGFVASTK